MLTQERFSFFWRFDSVNRYWLRSIFTIRLINLDKLIGFDIPKDLSRAAGGRPDLYRVNLSGAAKTYFLPQ